MDSKHDDTSSTSESLVFPSSIACDGILVPPYLDVLPSGSSEESLFMCPICQCILGTPTVQTPCEHNYCAPCLLGWFKHSMKDTVPCPVCTASVNISEVKPCPRILRVQLSMLSTACITCGMIGKLENMLNHVCEQKCTKPTSFVCYPSTETLASPEPSIEAKATMAARLLKSMAEEHIEGSPILPEIEAAADRWIWHKLRHTSSARLKKPGRVILALKLKCLKLN